jgi:hypothetical protein
MNNLEKLRKKAARLTNIGGALSAIMVLSFFFALRELFVLFNPGLGRFYYQPNETHMNVALIIGALFLVPAIIVNIAAAKARTKAYVGGTPPPTAITTRAVVKSRSVYRTENRTDYQLILETDDGAVLSFVLDRNWHDSFAENDVGILTYRQDDSDIFFENFVCSE